MKVRIGTVNCLFVGSESVSIAVMLIISITLVTLVTLVTRVSLVMLMSLVETNKDASYVSGFIVASDGCKASDAFLTPWVIKEKLSPSFVRETFTVFCDETKCFDRYGRCRGNGSIICMWM